MKCLSKDEEKNIEALRSGYSRFVNLEDAVRMPANEELSEMLITPVVTLREYDNWFFYNGEFHYFKERKGLTSMVNELLGQELSEYMNLPTIKYQIAQKDGKIVGLISPNFKDLRYDYFDSRTLSREQLKSIRELFVSGNISFDEKTRELLTAYILRNYYASQKDRQNNSLYAKSSREPFIMSPLFDYEASFDDPTMLSYVDPLLSYTFTPESTDIVMKNNPYFKEYLEYILAFDVKKALNNIESKQKINIPFALREQYYSFDTERREFMSEMGLKKIR